jgi:hypothetical protein
MKECELITEGHIDDKRFYGFEQLRIEHLQDGTTSINCIIVDQAMLFALLNRARDLGLKLISVKIMEK